MTRREALLAIAIGLGGLLLFIGGVWVDASPGLVIGAASGVLIGAAWMMALVRR